MAETLSPFDSAGFDLSSIPLQQLSTLLSHASLALPPGYRVRVTSADRPGARVGGGGGVSQHALGDALDIQIVGPDGPIPNRGEDTTGLYSKLAGAARAAQSVLYPELEGKLAWGGSFGVAKGSNVRDLMHFDLAGERGSLGAPNPLQITSGSAPPAANSLSASLSLPAAVEPPSNPLAVKQRETVEAALPPLPEPAVASPLAMMGLLAAGTHKFVPISYDPFKTMPDVSPDVVAPAAAPSITSKAPQVSIRAPEALPLYSVKIGGVGTPPQKGPGNLGMDPQLQNAFAGVA